MQKPLRKTLPFVLTVAAFVALLTLAPATGRGQQAAADSSRSDLEVKIAAAVEQTAADQQLVGVAVAVIQDGEVSIVSNFGWENKEEQIPVSGETMFRWASISKPVTAILAMQLANDGKLDLDDDVRKLVSEFPEKKVSDAAVVVTARQLLCHQSGVPHYTNGPVIATRREYEVENPFEDVVLALDRFRESPLVHKPGERYAYTTHGYMLLGAVVQRGGGQKFAEQARERVFYPLGMTTMRPDYQWEDISHRAVGYRLRSGEVRQSTDTDVSWKLAGGGFISTVGDLGRFGAGLMTEKLLPRETLDEMWTPQSTNDGSATTYGLGFGVGSFQGHRRVGHTGSQEKTRTSLAILPDKKLGVAIMTNSENANLGRLTNEILRLLVAEE